MNNQANTKPHNRFYSYLNSAAAILQLYDGTVPFAYFLKIYFAANKKIGGRDRKQISQLCYAYFRLGKAFTDRDVQERMLLALKSVNENPEEEWVTIIRELGISGIAKPGNIFPWKEELSDGVDYLAFEHSFLKQPDLFIRTRPGFEELVTEKIKKAGIAFNKEGMAMRLPNTVKIHEILHLNKEAVVQDFSSQQITSLLLEIKKNTVGQPITVFDACAASGGKSILAKDMLDPIQLTVADIRPSIIANLKKRFMEAGIKDYEAFVVDITQNKKISSKRFDLVIADVPCTGSGTWSRTPEQLYYFDVNKIQWYATKQKGIVRNLVALLNPGGYFLYITCSVFKKENEEQVRLLQEAGLQVVMQVLLPGYEKKADTMFAALLRK